MKKFLITLICLLMLTIGISCTNSNNTDKNIDNVENSKTEFHSIINEKGATVQDRFNTPNGYKRTSVESNSFGEYLRNLPMKPHGYEVKYFNGKVKTNYNVYDGVIDIDVGDRDLQQCADAVMRLRSEYLYGQKKYDDIHFNFVNGFNAEYSKWRQGYRISISNDDKASWIKKSSPSTDYESFRKYLNVVFAYAGTASLHKELNSVKIEDMQIGDVFIQTKNPYGHAVIVVDMAENEKGEKLYMLAQSYMPAQDIQILHNRSDEKISPWYKLSDKEAVSTPEWQFTKNDLKRF